MGLKLNLKAGERVIINGAVITAEKATSIILHNMASVLSERHVIRPNEATTPARRLYYAIQCSYVATPDELPAYLRDVEILLNDYETATTIAETHANLRAMRSMVEGHRYYDAMRLCRDLIKYEDIILGMHTKQKAAHSFMPE
jgi:flagellar protein FlbT